MAQLNFQKFAVNDRIRRAADNAPPMKPGESDRDAVKILQDALIQAGFPIRDGATGFYGPQTVTAVQAVERKYGLDTDSGITGHQVITRLDALLAGKPVPVARPALMQLLLQHTNTLGGFTHRSYFLKATALLKDFGLGLDISNHFLPEKHTPGMRPLLRVIFCRFAAVGQSGEKFFGTTEGGRRPLEGGALFPDFILVNVEMRRPDDSTLIHEMIHATGLDVHDPDPASVFADGLIRTGSVLKSEHAERLRSAFFARLA